MSWLILAFVLPIAEALFFGSTYRFALGISGTGVVLYVANALLIRRYIKKRLPSSLDDGSWELTAGLGIVPRWVSTIGLIGIGFVPSGLIVAALLWFGLVATKGA